MQAHSERLSGLRAALAVSLIVGAGEESITSHGGPVLAPA
jgi:hypothetical protein